MLPPPSHICPKCKEAQVAEAFVNAKGEPTKWCSWCRESYRSRFIKPKKSVEAGAEAVAWEVVAKDEKYADHPLAKLLALSHLVGAKKALAIKAGKGSWKAGKEWQLYGKAKRELEALLAPPSLVQQTIDTLMSLPPGYTWRVYRGEPPVLDEQLTKLVNDQQCDPNSEPVS